MGQIKLLNQCDSRWKSIKLGDSSESVCKSGCLTTDLSSLSAWYGSYINPGKLAQKLSYTPQGYLIWKSIDEVLPFRFVWRYYSQNDAKIREILNSVDGACILHVRSPYILNHWVLLVGYSRLTGYRVFDPLHGDIVNLSKRSYRIQGFTELTRK